MRALWKIDVKCQVSPLVKCRKKQQPNFIQFGRPNQLYVTNLVLSPHSEQQLLKLTANNSAICANTHNLNIFKVN